MRSNRDGAVVQCENEKEQREKKFLLLWRREERNKKNEI